MLKRIKSIISVCLVLIVVLYTSSVFTASAITMYDSKSDTEDINADTDEIKNKTNEIKADTGEIKGKAIDTNQMTYDIWNYMCNELPNAINKNGGGVSQSDVDDIKNSVSNVQESVNNIDIQKEMEEYYASLKTSDSSIPGRIYNIPQAFFAVNNILWKHIGNVIQNDVSAPVGGVGSFTLNPLKYKTGDLSNIFKTFGYTLVLVFFAANLIESTIKYEIFTLKGGVKFFGRIIISKTIIDMSGTVCEAILNTVGTLSLRVYNLGINSYPKGDTMLLGAFPEIKLETSDLWIVGPIIDGIMANLLIIPLMLINIVIFISTACIVVKLILRSFELSMLVAVSPAFFACYSSEITKPYFKNFILTFIQVAAQIVFMGIVYYIGASHVITEMGEIDGFEGLISWFGKIAPNMLIIIAMSIMMIKPPRCLTNLIK